MINTTASNILTVDPPDQYDSTEEALAALAVISAFDEAFDLLMKHKYMLYDLNQVSMQSFIGDLKLYEMKVRNTLNATSKN